MISKGFPQCSGPSTPPGAGSPAGGGSGGNNTDPNTCSPGGNNNGEHGGGGGSRKKNGGTPINILTLHASDPNEIQGPVGVNAAKWMAGKDNFSFIVRFENDPEFATGPAQKVLVSVPIDARFDISTLRVGNFGFGNRFFSVPANSPTYYHRLDVRDSLGLYIDVLAGIDIPGNQALWVFESIDPATGAEPTNPALGFLPVRDTSINRFNDSIPNKGEGFVTFTIQPRSTAHTGDSVKAQASILFDLNPPVLTNVEKNILDVVPPVSKINMATVTDNVISLFWTGADDRGGSGTKEYSIYVSKDGSPYSFYQKTEGLSTNFTGIPGSTYCFFTIASDSVNNIEAPLKNNCEISAVLSTGALPLTWLYFRGQEKGNDAVLSWSTGSEINTDYFIVERSLDGQTFQDIGKVKAAGNSLQSNAYGYTDQHALSLNTQKIYYRLRQVDKDGKFTYSNIITIVVRNNSEQVIKIYPTPFTRNLTLVISTVKKPDADDQLELYSMNGALLYKQGLSARQNNSPIVLNNLMALSPGTYILTTILNGKTSSIKIIKQ